MAIETWNLRRRSFTSGLLRGGASEQVTVGTVRREGLQQNGGEGAALSLVEAGGATFGGLAAAPPLPQSWWVQGMGETTPPCQFTPPGGYTCVFKSHACQLHMCKCSNPLHRSSSNYDLN